MKLKALVSYSAQSTHVQTTLDYLHAIKDYSGFEVSYVHVTHAAMMDFDIDEYDILFQNYCARLYLPGYVSSSYRDAVRGFRGLKVIAVQDEYDHTDELKRAIKDLGFHIVLTCVPQDSLEYVYPRMEFPNVRFETVLTGYVPDHFLDDECKTAPVKDRSIVIGYRGRDIGGLYGKLGYEKYEIGRRMREICTARNIKHDIAVDEESRIYGDKWFDFIASCRSMLGSESGSNVFDFDGSIREKYKEMAAKRDGRVSYEEFLPFVEQRDTEIDMGQISPRVFECAVMKTPMVLFRGRYSDALQPDEHYIPLEKDFSNVEDVLARLNDMDALQALADRAYEHLVASRRFGYRAYWEKLVKVFREELSARTIQLAASRASLSVTSDAVAEKAATGFEQRPTQMPQGLEIFASPSQIVIESLSRAPSVHLKVVRKFWRLLPLETRLRIITRLARVIDDNSSTDELSLPMKLAIRTWRRVPEKQRARILERISA